MASERGRRKRRGAEDVRSLIGEALGYVPSVARRYLGNGLALDELVAAGNLGLVEAALRFDASRNLRFVTYADWWVRKAIVEAIETLSGPVRLPRYRHERLRWIKQAAASWTSSKGRPPTSAELAAATGMARDQVSRLLASEPRGVSLDHPSRPGEGRPLAESIGDPSSVCPQRSVVRRDLGRHLRRKLGRLGERERSVIRLRFGLDGGLPRTLRQTGRLLGLSRERVRQIELGALLKIRREL